MKLISQFRFAFLSLLNKVEEDAMSMQTRKIMCQNEVIAKYCISWLIVLKQWKTENRNFYKTFYYNFLVRLSMPGEQVFFSKYLSRVSSITAKPSFL